MSSVESNHNRTTNRFWNVRTLQLLIVGLFLVSLIKRIFVGLDIDEQYSVTLLYRMATGDIPVKEMWEPHQTSAIVPGILAKLYMLIKGDTEYMLVFLRVAGALTQAAVAYAWYRVVSRKTQPWIATFSAGIILFVLPKWIQSPEFTNMQIWMLILTALLVINSLAESKDFGLLIAGFFFTLEVLDYPSCVLLVFVFAAILLKHGFQKVLYFFAVPVVSLAAFIVYIFRHMSFAEFKYAVGHIMSDGSHSAALSDKLLGYAEEIPSLIAWLLVYAAISVVLILVMHLCMRRKVEMGRIYVCFLCVWPGIAMLDQFRFWLVEGSPIVRPQYGYFALFMAGWLLWLKEKASLKDKWGVWVHVLYPASLVAFVSILLLTNLDMKASFVHLLPAMLVAVVLMAEKCVCLASAEDIQDRIKVVSLYFLTACIAALLLFGQFVIVKISNEGNYEDIFLVRQKSLYGYSKLVYCAYMEGYESNDNYLLLTGDIPAESRVLYIGQANGIYMLGDYEVCKPSTISTPDYSDLTDYYSFNSDKLPEYVVFEKSYVGMSSIDEADLITSIGVGVKFEQIAESDFIGIYRLVY